MGGLVQIHEVMSIIEYGRWRLNWVCKCKRGLRNPQKPSIHIFAGKEVCIQSTRPAQHVVAFAAWQRAVMLSALTMTGFAITFAGIAEFSLNAAVIAGVCSDTRLCVLNFLCVFQLVCHGHCWHEAGNIAILNRDLTGCRARCQDQAAKVISIDRCVRRMKRHTGRAIGGFAATNLDRKSDTRQDCSAH